MDGTQSCLGYNKASAPHVHSKCPWTMVVAVESTE